jgi:hypothetical protein
MAKRKKVIPAEQRNSHGEPRQHSGGTPLNLDAIAETRRLWKMRVRPAEIRRRVAEACGITEDTALDYIRRVRAEFAPHDEAEREQEVEQMLAAIDEKRAEFERLAADALVLDPGPNGVPHTAIKEARECHKQALECLRELSRLRGLHAAKKLDVTVTSGVLVVGGGPSEGQSGEDWAAAHSVTTTLPKGKP